MYKRLASLINALGLSAAQFADEIGVQRSSISHVISGRNKPSMDFIEKILKRYPRVNADWLILGSGSQFRDEDLFTGQEKTAGKEKRQKDTESGSLHPMADMKVQEPQTAGQQRLPSPGHPLIPADSELKGKQIRQIILVYNDNTFSALVPEVPEDET